MRPCGRTPQCVVVGGMDFCWIYAWARFTTSSLIPQPFPLFEAILALTLGAVLVRVLRGRGWPVISILGCHLLLFTAASGLILRASFAPHVSPWEVTAWLGALSDLAPPFGWVRVAVVGLWTICLWVHGVRLPVRPGDTVTVSNRFDMGLAAFFALLLVQSFISLQLGGVYSGGETRYLMLSFLAFGFLGLTLSQSRTLARKQYRTGFRAAGVVLTFSAVSLFLGTGLVTMFFPYLTRAAGTGYAEMKAAASHAEPYLISILRFMFGPRGGDPAGEKAAAAGGMVSVASPPFQYDFWLERMVTVTGWAFLGLLGFAAMVAAGVCLWYLLGRLFSRTDREPDDVTREGTTSWWTMIVRLLGRFPFARRLGKRDPIQLFLFLKAWGNRSGLPHRPQETPSEYEARLKERFPRFKGDFEQIIGLFNRRLYGEMDPRPAQLKEGQSARQRLSNPLRWPSRLRSRLSGTR